MKKILLEEQVNKSLKLMGILNEASSPVIKKIFQGLFGGLSNLDNVMNKIEAKVGSSFRTKTLAGIEAAIASNKITRKEVIGYIISDLNKSPDEIVDMIVTNSPDIMTTLTSLAKTKTTKQELIGAVPGLNDLPNNIVDTLLRKSGAVFANKVTVRDFILSISTNYPDLFAAHWYRGFKNESFILGLFKEVEMKFSGKNLTALEKEIKDMMAKASSSVDDAVQKKKLLEAEGGTVKSTLLKAGEGFIRTITPIRKSVSGDVLWLKTGFTGMMEVSMIFLLYKFTNVLLSTDSPTAATVTVVKNEISSGIAAATGVENASNNTSGKFGNSIPELRSFIKSLSASYTQDMVDGLAIKSQGGGKYEVTLPGGSKVFTHNGTTFTF
jgi:hypothetical protein